MNYLKMFKPFSIKKFLHWQDYIYIGGVTGFTLLTILSFPTITLAACYFVVFALLLIGAKYITKPVLLKYLLAIISYFVYFVTVDHYKMPWHGFEQTIFYLPLIYAYLLPDKYSTSILAVPTFYLFYNYRTHVLLFELIGDWIGFFATAALTTMVFRLIDHLRLERDKYRKLSLTDSLTGLYNLNYILQLGQEMFESSREIAVVMADLNGFKQINDTFGHIVGNKILIQMSRILNDAFNSDNMVIGRFGGDEFIVLFKGYPRSKVQELKDILLEMIEQHKFLADPNLDSIKITCSIGVAYSDDKDFISFEEILNHADINMYYHKYEKSARFDKPDLSLTSMPDPGWQLLVCLAEKDMYTYIHSKYTAEYAARLASALGLPLEIIEQLRLAGWLHDIGKLLTPRNILRKRTKLTITEFDLIKRHVNDGLNILHSLNLPPVVRNAIQYHQERWDGHGYPSQTDSSNTPLEGRIMQIADSFSAMTIKRVYKEQLSFKKALEELRHCGGQFDPDLVSVFIQMAKVEYIPDELS